jgi:hypothetical protein
MLGFMGLYHDGWTIAGKPYRIPWSLDPSVMANFDPLNTEWELYNIRRRSHPAGECSGQYPEKVKELEKLFWEEAEKYDVSRLAVLWAGHCSRNPIRSGLEKDTGN